MRAAAESLKDTFWRDNITVEVALQPSGNLVDRTLTTLQGDVGPETTFSLGPAFKFELALPATGNRYFGCVPDYRMVHTQQHAPLEFGESAPFGNLGARLLSTAIHHVNTSGDLLKQLRKQVLFCCGMIRTVPEIAHFQRVADTVN